MALKGILPPLAFGIVAGLVAAAWVAGFMEALLFEIQPLDPVTFILAPLFLAGVALAATYLPARRAAALDPMSVLKGE